MLQLNMELLLVGLLVLFAAFMGTISGFGMSSIMLPLLSLYYPLPETLLFVGIIHFFGDLWKILLFKNGFKFKLILLFGLPGIITGYIGARSVFSFPEVILTRLLGLVLIFFVLLIFVKPNFKLPNRNWITAMAGSIDGLLAGITGIGGPIRSVFLSAFDFPKAVYIAASGAIGMMIDSVRITTYINGGIELNRLLGWGLIIFIPVSFTGAKLGKKVVNKIPQERFRYLVGSFLLVIACLLLVNSL